jgi:hypothetical protein
MRDQGNKHRQGTVRMRTAARKEVTSFGTFLSTLCHEFCPHLDFKKFGFVDSWHVGLLRTGWRSVSPSQGHAVEMSILGSPWRAVAGNRLAASGVALCGGCAKQSDIRNDVAVYGPRRRQGLRNESGNRNQHSPSRNLLDADIRRRANRLPSGKASQRVRAGSRSLHCEG